MAFRGRHLGSIFIVFFELLIFLVSCCRYGGYVDASYFGGGFASHAYPSCFPSSLDENKHDLLKIRSKLLSDLQSLGNTKSTSLVDNTFSVDHYGAIGDGSRDDTKAFERAWEAACSAKGDVVLEVPEGNTYVLKPITFSGPCKSTLTLEVRGTMEASDDRSDYEKNERHWIRFDRIQNLVVEGGGTIDGNGNIWWQNSCKVNKTLPCKNAPTAVTFYKCKSLTVKDIRIENGQQMHVSFQKCSKVVACGLTVRAPGDSPNTDGIHVTATKNIQILHSVIATGDDCISIVSGSKKVEASNITCGPGHGISIGSLGSENSEAHVSRVTINGAKLFGTTNGVRIKTWQGGSGNASDIKFKNIEMNNVTNPIIIDQHYCDEDHDPCQEQTSAVQVRNVVYEHIRGTSASWEAIQIDCSETYPCEGVVLRDVHLEGAGGGPVIASCRNVDLTEKGSVSPCCDCY